eukprot:203733_1
MPALFKYLSQKLPIKYLNKMRNIPHRSYGKIPLTMRRTLPILSRPKLSSQSVRRRFYSNNFNNNDLLERLRTGQITKAEVQRLIMNQQSNPTHQSSNGYKTIQSMSDYPTQMQPPIHTGTAKITPMHATGGITASSSIPTISTIGSKTNPLYMKRQTSFKEFIFSLFPFLFIFWMLGGLDFVRNRKQGGVGGMFGNNYSEWDEEDWEDDDDELTNEDGTLTTLKNKSDEKHHTKDKEQNEEDQLDRRAEFFKKLGIDLKANQDQDQSRDTDNKGMGVGTQQMAVKKDKKKRKRVRFKNVCGNEEAKVDLIDLVDYLKNPNKYQKMGCKLPKGVLMAGPPGTGKTLLARALAGEAGVPFLATNGASFDDGDSQNIFWMLPAVFIILGMPLSLPIMFFVYQSTSNMLSSSMFSKAQLFREWIIESITNESILYDKIYVYLRVHHRPPAPQAVCNESQPFLIDLNLTKTQDKSNTLEYLRWNMRR